MSIRFACEHCGQRLNVGRDKSGVRARCPKCREKITVPAESQPAEPRLAGEAAAEKAFAARGEMEPDPFAEFAVYDDVEWVYESGDDVPVTPASRRRRVAVPRAVLFTQGVLLGVVAIVAFLLGILMARSRTAEPQRLAAQPCVVSGAVAFVSQAGRELPDEGAVVMLLPTAARPDPTKKAQVAGLRPGDPVPRPDSESLRTLDAIGGAYVRTDSSGRFEARLPDRGRYYVLVVSKNATRGAGEEVDKADIAQLGRYMQPPTEMLSDRRYRWQEVVLRGDKQLDFTY